LDGKFWVWETLEEATRGHIERQDEATVAAVLTAFGANYKGSEALWNNILQRTA
jgi:hypothetical protein